MIRNFRVVYGETRLACKDFQTIDGVLDFVRRTLKRHPDWTVGDSWRDEVSVVQFVPGVDGALDSSPFSSYVRDVV